MRATHASKPRVEKAAPRSRKLRQPREGLRPHPAEGSDLLTTLEIVPRLPKYTVIKTLKVGPRGFGSARLDLESKLWARWRPTKLNLRVVCAGSTSTFGSIVVGWIPDPTHHWLNQAESSISRIISSPHHVVLRLSSSGNLSIPVATTRKWYHTSGADEDSYHGQIAIVSATPTGGYSGSSVGVTIELDWRVEFEGEDLPDADATPDNTIYADAGWTNLFTTSDGSFNSSVLTFKEHSGGSMAPFSAARYGVVYTTAANSSVTYYDSSGKEQRVKYFTRISSYDTPGLILFATFQDARDYISSGSIDKALKYHSAGKICIPPSPGFEPTSSVMVQDPAVDRIAELENLVHKLMRKLEFSEVYPRQINMSVADKMAITQSGSNSTRLTKENEETQRLIERQSLGTLLDPVVTTILPVPILRQARGVYSELESITSSVEVIDDDEEFTASSS